jgi:hypothetical protein
MLLENLMYFALGLLIAALGALIVLPAVWRRAVRLTKKRIEAATPITMSEFRADKDQLRAEFALQTRRLEMTVETLRKRLADQLRDVNRSKLEMDGLDGERTRHQQITAEFEEREAAQRQRVLALEKEVADLSQKLRMRERELADKVAQLEETRQAKGQKGPQRNFTLDGVPLSGTYETDVEALLSRLEGARAEAAEAIRRAALLTPPPTVEAEKPADATETLREAEAHIAQAEERVASLLAETAPSSEDKGADTSLAERMAEESELASIQANVSAVERDVIADWGTDRIDKDALRQRLGEIANQVGLLVRAGESPSHLQDKPAEESLYDRVQKFAGSDDTGEPAQPEPAHPHGGLVSERLKALEQLQERS